MSVLGVLFFAQSCEAKKDNAKTTTEETVKTDTIHAEEPIGNPTDVKADPGTFQIKPLKYGYDELNEYIDAKTMEIHFSKHYLGYINKLNAALKESNNKSNDIVEILKSMDMNNGALRNNAGGYYNHMLYFDIMSPSPQKAPTGDLKAKIESTFGSTEELIKLLDEAGAKRFGSGWAWLVVKADGSLAVTSTANQDNPLMPGAEVAGTPILGIDVWEHAYYLKYQNKRDEYLKAFTNVLDWKQVEENYKKAK
ncbi:MAG: superoxide dismutase [Algoriella sp.]|nr:superoxide dismutase [Algoriella sp.]